jgi:tRNA nucleotidyltransferase (CCA-adding enzyme)
MSSNQEAFPLPSLGDAHNAPLPEQLVEWVNRLPNDINSIITKIAEAGGGVWIVGGAVRDALLGLEDEDIDLAVSLPPEKMLELFPNALPTGIAFGTLTLRGEEGRFYEATTLRTESEYNDGRRPEVVNFGTSLLGDLERRDFTFNAMAIDVRRHLLHDPFNGQGDLEKKRVRAVGQAYQRLSEDGLRILRAYRFLDRGEAGVWRFDPELSEALLQHRSMLSGVTNERIWMEWQKILAGQNAPDVIERMARDGVLDRFLPGKWSGQGHRMFAQRHSLCSTLNPLERFALLLAENDSIEVERTLKHLKLSKKDRKNVETIHQRFGRVPKNNLADLRVYRSVLQKRSKNHLEMEKVIRESGLKIPKMDSVNSEEIDVLLHRLEELEPLRAGDESIVDGHWIMQRTGLGKGIVLGRLKMWLHRIQIERDLADSDAVEAALCSLNWEHANDAHWPKVEF